MDRSTRSTRLLATALGLGIATVAGLAASSATAGGRPLSTDMTGAAEVPGPGDPDGTGTADLTVNLGLGEICYELTVANIAPGDDGPHSLRARRRRRADRRQLDSSDNRVVCGLRRERQPGGGEEHPPAPRAVLRERAQRRVAQRRRPRSTQQVGLSAAVNPARAGRADGRRSLSARSTKRRAPTDLPRTTALDIAATTASTDDTGTPTIDEFSLMRIGPICAPARPASLAIAPTRSAGRTPPRRPRLIWTNPVASAPRGRC